VEGLAAGFCDRSAAQETAKSSEAQVEKLHAKIGQLLVERVFGESLRSMSVERRRR
jgi:transposase